MIGWRSGSTRISGILVLVAFLMLGSAAAWGAPGDYDGTYAGTFWGDDHGYWVAIIDYAGESLFLSYSTDGGIGDGGIMYWGNEVGTTGNYYGWSEINGSFIDAYIDSTIGYVDGTWSNSITMEDGEFTGDVVTSNDYAGTYSGTFSGDESGTWSATIAADGYVAGAMVLGGHGYSFRGGCHPLGYFSAVGEDGDGYTFAVFAQISGDSVSGSWVSEAGADGTVTGGTGDTLGGGGGGGGGSSGCFIRSLIGQ